MAGTIAFIGCGAMGAPIAERLIDGGFPLRIFDINKEAMRPLIERGAVAGDSPSGGGSRHRVRLPAVAGNQPPGGVRLQRNCRMRRTARLRGNVDDRL
jgi:hypothetical protein